MIGYGIYWTAGFNPYQLRTLFKKHNVTEFDFISIRGEYDRVTGSVGLCVHLLGLRFWLCVSVAEPSEEFITALKEIAEDAHGQTSVQKADEGA